jgi:hypothetical protein
MTHGVESSRRIRTTPHVFWLSAFAFMLVDAGARGSFVHWPLTQTAVGTFLLTGAGLGLVALVHLAVVPRMRHRLGFMGWMLVAVSVVLLAAAVVEFASYLD